MKSLSLLALAGLAQAQSYAAAVAGPVIKPLEGALNSTVEALLKGSPVTSQILADFIEPFEVLIARNEHVTRNGTQLKLNDQPWTASGANVYWLGLDENVIPPKGQPFYAKFNASYPTHGRITEVMNTLNTMGARTIRSQTLGVSVGNPLSVMPSLGVYNEKAFDTIDWTVYQAREHGIRIFAPLIDNYDYYHGGKYNFLRYRGIDINTTAGFSKVDPRVMEFYTNATIIQDFKNYIKHLITHKNPYTGLTYVRHQLIHVLYLTRALSVAVIAVLTVLAFPPNPDEH
jgi:mannan endo-1,4-beta-mannosidase